MTHDEMLITNGIDALTGRALVPPLRLSEAAAFLKGAPDDPAVTALLQSIWRGVKDPHLGLPMDVDPASVPQAGWAVVFHQDEPPATREALAPLIEHRRGQVAEDRIKVLEYRSAGGRGEGRAQWLARHGVGAGTVDPTKVPFYLLLVGGPEKIPFTFGHLLDVEYAVGLLQFDTAEEYARYAESVVRYETGEPVISVARAKEAVFFATRHDYDRATQLSADSLVQPLANGKALAECRGFRSLSLVQDEATKERLSQLFDPPAGTRPPAFLFTATHGVGFPCGHSLQLAAQGALLCQDWSGFGALSPEHYFAAADLPASARVHGLVAFHFACYGGGTPSHDRFFHKPGMPPPAIADQPFLAALPKALLAHPGGGALAVIAHVERAWGYSIVTANAGPQLLPFENAIGRILSGQPVGHAMKDFNERYAALATSLSSLVEEVSFGAAVSDFELVSSWAERNDAEGYVVLGDPAVQMRVDDL
ncbi:MAG TPA: hypothetical protein VGS22_24790 [Thermoanaerobaculia bacterium]|jgi:hypothetical protein|nr:hypothetical protein [Thermoanaerobaculia bacterium]